MLTPSAGKRPSYGRKPETSKPKPQKTGKRKAIYASLRRSNILLAIDPLIVQDIVMVPRVIAQDYLGLNRFPSSNTLPTTHSLNPTRQ